MLVLSCAGPFSSVAFLFSVGLVHVYFLLIAACFDIPTCEDQSKDTFVDTHAVGATLFSMKFPDPAYHFYDDFSKTWPGGLEWTLDSSDLDVAAVDPHSGRSILSI